MRDDAVRAGGLLRQDAAHQRIERAARRVDAGEVHPVDIAVLLLRHAGDAREERIGDLEIQAGAQIDPVTAAIGDFGIAARPFGLLRIELDRAADRVAAGERALRAAQDLDAVEIEQIEHRSGQGRIIDVVDIEADPRLQRRAGIILADAADIGAERRPEHRALLLERDRRCLVGDFGDVGLAARLKGRAGNGGDRDRRILQLLRSELGGHHDIADRSRRRLIGRALRGSGAGNRLAGCSLSPCDAMPAQRQSSRNKQPRSRAGTVNRHATILPKGSLGVAQPLVFGIGNIAS